MAFTDLERVLARAEYLVVCCPETDETRGLIGAAQLRRLPHGAILVNVARGTVVDEPALIEALRDAEAVILAPSNPFVSVGPILAVPGLRTALESTKAVRAAISPIIAGQVVKGPAAKMLQTLGHEVSALGVAKIYAGLIDLMVIDEQDRALAPAIEALGMHVAVTDTMMTSIERKTELAAFVIDACAHVR